MKTTILTVLAIFIIFNANSQVCTVEQLKSDIKTVMADASNGFSVMQGEMSSDDKYSGKYYECSFQLCGTARAKIRYVEEDYYKFTQVTIPREFSFLQIFYDTTTIGKFVTKNIESIFNEFAKEYKLKKKVTFEGKDKKRKELGNKKTTYSTPDGQSVYRILEDMDRKFCEVSVFSTRKNMKQSNYLGTLILYNLESQSFSKSAIVCKVYGDSLNDVEALYVKVRAGLQYADLYTKYEWLPNRTNKEVILHLDPLNLHLDYRDVNANGTRR